MPHSIYLVIFTNYSFSRFLMNWMRLCFEKKKKLWLFHVKSVSPPPPRSGSGGGQRRRGGAAAAAAGADRDTSVLRLLYVKYIGLKNGFYLNYHNQFKIMIIKMKRSIYRPSVRRAPAFSMQYFLLYYILSCFFFSAHMAVIVLESYICLSKPTLIFEAFSSWRMAKKTDRPLTNAPNQGWGDARVYLRAVG